MMRLCRHRPAGFCHRYVTAGRWPSGHHRPLRPPQIRNHIKNQPLRAHFCEFATFFPGNSRKTVLSCSREAQTAILYMTVNHVITCFGSKTLPATKLCDSSAEGRRALGTEVCGFDSRLQENSVLHRRFLQNDMSARADRRKPTYVSIHRDAGRPTGWGGCPKPSCNAWK